MTKCDIHRYTEKVYDKVYGRLVCPECEKEEDRRNKNLWFRQREWDEKLEEENKGE